MSSFTLALPSKGELAEPTDSFLRDAGLKVLRPNPRQYTGTIPALPGLNVLFQRVKDVVYKVADGTAQLGVAGLDLVVENPHTDMIVIHNSLNYGHCNLAVAVPEAWIDVSSMDDLVEVAQDIREHHHRSLRIATTFPHMTREFFHRKGIHYFTIVKAEGAIEAAPTIGYADVIVDLTQSGTTLRENHLKTLRDGTIVESQACLIGNRQALKANPELLIMVRKLLDYTEAALSGREFCQLVVDVRGDDPAMIAQRVMENAATQGLLGPTIAPIYTRNSQEQWYTVTITVTNRNLHGAVEYLRSIGGSHVIISPVKFLFREQVESYERLLANLEI